MLRMSVAVILLAILCGCSPVPRPKLVMIPMPTAERDTLIPNPVPIYETPIPSPAPLPEEILIGIGLGTGHDFPPGALTGDSTKFEEHGELNSWVALDCSMKQHYGRIVKIVVIDPETYDVLIVRLFTVRDCGFFEQAGKFRWNGWMFVEGEQYEVVADFPWRTFLELGDGKTLLVEVWLI